MRKPDFCLVKKVFINYDGSVSVSKTKLVKNAFRVTLRASGLWLEHLYYLPDILIRLLKKYLRQGENEITDAMRIEISQALSELLNDLEEPEFIDIEVLDDFTFKIGVSEAQREQEAELHSYEFVNNSSEEDLANYIYKHDLIVGHNGGIAEAERNVIFAHAFNEYLTRYTLHGSPC